MTGSPPLGLLPVNKVSPSRSFKLVLAAYPRAKYLTARKVMRILILSRIVTLIPILSLPRLLKNSVMAEHASSDQAPRAVELAYIFVELFLFCDSATNQLYF